MSLLPEYATLPAPWRHVLRTLALFAAPVASGDVAALAARLGDALSTEALSALLTTLQQAGEVRQPRPARWQVAPARLSDAYLDALDRTADTPLRDALLAVLAQDSQQGVVGQRFASAGSAVSLLRLVLHQGADEQRVGRYRAWCGPALLWPRLLAQAALFDADPRRVARLAPPWQRYFARCALTQWWGRFDPARQPWLALAQACLASGGDDAALADAIATGQILAGAPDAAQASLTAAATDEAAPALLAFARGQWAEARDGFAAALARQPAGDWPPLPYVFYPLALMADGSLPALTRARQVCERAAQAADDDSNPWSVLGQALALRLGETADVELGLRSTPQQWDAADFWRLLVRAWLVGSTPRVALTPADADALQRLHARLQACGFSWLVEQYDAALQCLLGQVPVQPFFAAASAEPWRVLLATLGEIAAEAPPKKAQRLLWRIDCAADGRVHAIQPWRQHEGVRGWSTPRSATLASVAADEALPAQDLRVARAIRRDGRTGWMLDPGVALAALVGHPQLEFADCPGQPAVLREAAPSLSLVEQDGAFRLTVTPLPPCDALPTYRLERDSPSHATLVRFTPAQLRAARLIGDGVEIPAAGRAALQQTLAGLARHFRVSGSVSEAAHTERVKAHTGLRAELALNGSTLRLRLVAAPFGPAGPRFPPGQGRVGVLAQIDGRACVTRRDLDAERAHLAAIVDALAPLPPLAAAAAPEWTLPQLEQALAVLARLPQLADVAGLDWPRGKALRVEALPDDALKLRAKGGADWLALEGEVRLDDEAVLSLMALLQAVTRSDSRFIELDAGRYLALTDALRSHLAELALLGQEQGDAVRLPLVAAGWLQQAGLTVSCDTALSTRLASLEAAWQAEPMPPAGLQVPLRDYQLAGYRWMMRLAHAGFGACLADDMGLGKTLQTLALLLARTGGGAALVVVPTSLSGNWQQEAQRFVPALRVTVYGEAGERAAQLAAAGAGDVVLVSYTQLTQAAETFAVRRWHTLVVDEAQAVKNAQAARSRAVQAIDADFRLVLSGTPVENRLAELWAIMQCCNPGLLGSAAQFAERFANPIEREGKLAPQQALRRLIAPFVLRRTKQQVLHELPPRTELLYPVCPGDAEAAWYEAIRRQALADAEESLAGNPAGNGRANVLAQLTRLRRAACDPRLVQPDIRLAGAKVIAFTALATELVAAGHKVLVFSQFVDFLALLRAPLDQAGIAYQYLDGATPVAERNRRVAAFQQGEGELFLISLKAGGFGLNLTAADYVIITDPWWNPAVEDQASARAHRMGQQRPVTVYRLVNETTLEARILRLHQDKRALADALLDAENGRMAPPSVAELLALMRA